MDAVEKLRRDLRRAQSRTGPTNEIMAELGVSFTANAVHSCYHDSHMVREMLSEAKVQRNDAWRDQVKKTKDELAETEKVTD